MDFKNYTCPVCDERFKDGDDVVVCPECGAPHHRDCYEQTGHCYYENRHSDDFSFEEIKKENQSGADNKDEEDWVCPNCGYKNERNAFFCIGCGKPLNAPRENVSSQSAQSGAQNTQQGKTTPPFGFGASYVATDPLGGLNSEEEIADNVTAGEMAKFVGKNTTYFSIVFSRIRKINRSRFSFSAFIFSGGYFLYRKMYFLGTVIALAMIALNVLSTYIMITPEWSQCYNDIMNTASLDRASLIQTVTQDGTAMMGKVLYIYLPFVLSVLRYVIMAFCGITANRKYYGHCTRKINEIKADRDLPDTNKALEQRGGVNMALAASFMIASVIISYICTFFSYQINI